MSKMSMGWKQEELCQDLESHDGQGRSEKSLLYTQCTEFSLCLVSTIAYDSMHFHMYLCRW